MIVGGCSALSWATCVLFLLLWTMMIDAPHVPIRPYSLTLWRRNNETGSRAKPEVNHNNVVHGRQRQSFAISAVSKDSTKHAVQDEKLFPVVDLLKSVAQQSKLHADSDIKRTTAEAEALSRRVESVSPRHRKRGVKVTRQKFIDYSDDLPAGSASKKSTRNSPNIDARLADDYYEQSYSDDDYDQSYHYPDTDRESSYSENNHQKSSDHAKKVRYADQQHLEHSYETYNKVSSNKTQYPKTSHQESAYSESSDSYRKMSGAKNSYQQSSYLDGYESGYVDDPYSDSSDEDGKDSTNQGTSDDKYSPEQREARSDENDAENESTDSEQDSYQETSVKEYDDDEEYEESSYQESKSDDYDDAYDSGYEQQSYSDSSYAEQDPYHEEEYDQPYEESEENGYDITGYEESATYEETYDSGAEGEYAAEDSYVESEYDYPQPYQPPEDEPVYESNSYLPDYEPTYSSDTLSYAAENDQQYSETAHEEESANKLVSYEEATYAESSHEPSYATDYDCPSPPGKIYRGHLLRWNYFI